MYVADAVKWWPHVMFCAQHVQRFVVDVVSGDGTMVLG